MAFKFYYNDVAPSFGMRGSSIMPLHDCAGGCDRKVFGAGWCRECMKGREKYMKYRDIMVALGERGHRCGTCNAYLGGCSHTYQALIMALEEKWPMVKGLK